MKASIDGHVVLSDQPVAESKGFVGFGVGGFYPAVFDDFSVTAGECGLLLNCIILLTHCVCVLIQVD